MKPRISTNTLIKAAQAAGAIDPPLVASCIRFGAETDGIEATIEVWRRIRPEWFRTVVVDASGAGSTGHEISRNPARR
jgi:hypothetical protein